MFKTIIPSKTQIAFYILWIFLHISFLIMGQKYYNAMRELAYSEYESQGVYLHLHSSIILMIQIAGSNFSLLIYFIKRTVIVRVKRDLQLPMIFLNLLSIQVFLQYYFYFFYLFGIIKNKLCPNLAFLSPLAIADLSYNPITGKYEISEMGVNYQMD